MLAFMHPFKGGIGTMIAATAKRLVRDYGIAYSASLLGFLIITLAAHVLGSEDFAWIAIGIALGSFALPWTTLGNDSVFVRDAVTIQHDTSCSQAERSSRVVNMAMGGLVTRSGILLVIGAGLLLSMPLYADNWKNGLASLCVAIWTASAGLYPAPWFDYINKTRQQNQMVLAERIASLAAVVALTALTEPTALGLAAVLLGVRLTSLVVQIDRWFQLTGVKPMRLRPALPRRQAGIDLTITLAASFYALMIYGNQLFLKGTPSELAAYSLAFQIMGLIMIFQNQAMRLMRRRIAEECRHPDRQLQSLARSAALIAGGSAMLSVAGWLVIALLPLVLADPNYTAMSRFAPWLCIWMVVSGAGIAVAQHVFHLHQTRFYLGNAILTGIVALALGAWLIPIHGGIAVIGILIGAHAVSICANALRVLAISRNIVSGSVGPDQQPGHSTDCATAGCRDRVAAP